MPDGKSSGSVCREYEARLEDFLDGVADAEVAAHLENCAGCRAAFEAAAFGRALLRENFEPTAEPGGVFSTRVMAAVRAEQRAGLERGAFWRPLEALASRLALTAAVLVLLLGAYVFGFAPPQGGTVPSPTQISEGFPEPPHQPANPDEVLQSLGGNGHGR